MAVISNAYGSNRTHIKVLIDRCEFVDYYKLHSTMLVCEKLSKAAISNNYASVHCDVCR